MIAADKNLADLIAAEGGQIVTLQHFSHHPITIGGPLTHKEPLKSTPIDARGQKTPFPQLSKTFFLCPKTTWEPPGSTWVPPETTY